MNTVLGIIGGSGVYDIDGLENPQWITVESPFGDPSDDLLIGTLDGVKMVFLPRHGRGHIQTPSSINYRANIDALKRAGVTDVISVSACGSFREEMAPGDFVIVDQFIDRTFAREKSFFGPGCVAHVSIAHPTCPRLGAACFGSGPSGGHHRPQWRHLPRDGRPTILHAGRKQNVPRSLGRRRDRHDQHARSQTRPRSRNVLRLRRDDHRFRQLAPRSRRSGRHQNHPNLDGQFRQSQRPRRPPP